MGGAKIALTIDEGYLTALQTARAEAKALEGLSPSPASEGQG